MGNAAVGGAKDVSNFMGCMDSNQMPDIASLTYEGLFYDYYFQTKHEDEKENQNHLIHPTYSCAKTKIPKAISMLPYLLPSKNDSFPTFDCPLPKDELQKLFQRFQQIDSDDCDGFITRKQLINSTVFTEYSLATNSAAMPEDDKIDFSEFVEFICSSKVIETRHDKEAQPQEKEEQKQQEKDEYEYYMTIGLNSSIDSNNLKRNKLNLVVCLDNSGSMNSTFNSVTQSQTKRELPPQCPMCHKFVKTNIASIGSTDAVMGEHMDSNCVKYVVDDAEQIQLEEIHKTERKCVMDVAKQSVLSLLEQLNEEDRFGLTVFNHECTVYQPLTAVKDMDMDKLKAGILKIKASGGTDMELAYKTSTSLYTDLFAKQADMKDENDYVKVVYPSPQSGADEAQEEGNILDEYWNRIIFITDAQPNTGKTDAESIMNLIQNNSDGEAKVFTTTEALPKDDADDDESPTPIYTTFIGVGLDMNAALINEITKVRGCNYYSVHSNEEFMRKMTEEFKFMVTPIAFDFKLELRTEGNGMCIQNVFGSGDDDQNKEFGFEVMNVSTLFPSPYNETKEIKGGVVLLKLKTNANNDIAYNMELDVSYKEVATGEIYSDKQRVVFGERNKNKEEEKDYFDHVGIRKAVLLTRYIQLLKQWMAQDNKRGNKLYVSQEFKAIFASFIVYFKEEMKCIQDSVLEKEVTLMQKLIDC
eukprot:78916_1